VAVEQKKDIKKICVAYNRSEPSKRALHMGKLIGKLFDAEVYAVHVGEGDLSAEVGEGVRYVRLPGIPEEKLVEYSKGMDLMLLGAFSKERIKEFFLGSVTTFVMHHANIPLLLVK